MKSVHSNDHEYKVSDYFDSSVNKPDPMRLKMISNMQAQDQDRIKETAREDEKADDSVVDTVPSEYTNTLTEKNDQSKPGLAMMFQKVEAGKDVPLQNANSAEDLGKSKSEFKDAYRMSSVQEDKV